MIVRSQRGRVKCQTRKWTRILSVFWTMKMTRSASPLSEAMAPPLSLDRLVGGLTGGSWLNWCPLSKGGC
jgi:hypothetical protein